MPYRITQISLAAAMVTSLAWPVASQELAKEVVNELFDQMTRMNGAVAPGAVVENGATVEWKDVVFGLPDGMGSYTLAFLRAEEIGGGKVSISFPDSISFSIDPKGEQPKMDISLNFAGNSHIVSGAKGAREHAWEADSIVAVISNASPGLTMNVTLRDMIGSRIDSMKGTGADAFGNYVGSFKAAVMNLNYGLIQGPVNMVSDITYNNVSGSFDFDEVSEETMNLLQNGSRNILASLNMESAIGKIDMTQPEMSLVMEIKTGKGGANYNVSNGVVAMASVGENAVLDVRMKDLPLPPFQVKMAKVDSILEMPLGKSEAPKKARIKLGLDGLVLSDTIWGMVDPTGQLARDEANLNVDLSAQMKWLVDLMKPEEMANAMMPATVDSVTINDVTLEIAGAKFTGTGAATIDNSSMPPMPVGEVNLDLKGGIGLLDKLVALGLLPQQQGMLIKGMSGMFTVPGGNGADHLTSKIEMQKGGVILANGQRIK